MLEAQGEKRSLAPNEEEENKECMRSLALE